MPGAGYWQLSCAHVVRSPSLDHFHAANLGWAKQQGLYHVLTTAFVAAWVPIGIFLNITGPWMAYAGGALAGVAVAGFQEALLHAADRPVLQLFTSSVVILCAATALITCYFLGAFAYTACVPATLAGGCCNLPAGGCCKLVAPTSVSLCQPSPSSASDSFHRPRGLQHCLADGGWRLETPQILLIQGCIAGTCPMTRQPTDCANFCGCPDTVAAGCCGVLQ